MLVGTYGSCWRNVDLVMFTLFLDDSGTRPTHRVAVATALIIPAAQIVRLQNEWDTLRAKEKFECFHASPCNAKDQKSEFANWSDEKVDRVFARVRHISKEYGVMAISSAVNKRYYDEEIPAEYKQYTGKYHYTWCMSYAVADAELWRQALPSRNRKPFEFVFSWMDEHDNPAKQEIENVMHYSERATRELGRRGEYEHYTFRRSEDIPPLQCADGIAWACNRYAIHRIHGKPLPRRARISWEYFGGPLGPAGWLRAFNFNRESLREYIRKEQADGRTLARFRRWEREDNEKKI
jgi:hypothetical protein